MIVNFKIFENNYKHLSTNEEDEMKEYVTPIIVVEYFEKKIPNLTLEDFEESHFSYRKVLDERIFDIFFFKNMYKYVRDNISDSITIEIYNSFQRIVENIISDSILGGYKTNIYMKLEKRLVEIFENIPESYKDYLNWYGEDLSFTLKEKLQYILDGEKYNL